MPAAPVTETPQQRLIVGIDYGTSNSGVAYALLEGDEDSDKFDINVISDWPQRASSHYSTSQKVPSDIAYDADSKEVVGCGFRIPGDAQPLQWVKLLLEPGDLTKKSKHNATRVWKSYHALDDKHLNKRPVDAVADYLRWLWILVKSKIEKIEEDEELFTTAKVTVVLTVPASWSERAKNFMAQAAKAAGIPERSLKLVAEPEAAAIFSLKKLSSKKRAHKREVETGDCVIVLDAGGGTVDAVAYQIHSHDPLSLNQATVPKGDFCGSAFIDSAFHAQIRSILGEDYDALDDEARTHIEQEFEYKIKRTYNPDEPQNYYIPVYGLEDDKDKGIAKGKMLVDDAVLSAAFNSVMTPIMALIDGQIKALREKGLENKLKGILLVGGFSASEFLHNRIREEFPGKDDIKIWKRDETWTACVQGAVAYEAYGSSNSAVVHTRLSSYNYGVPYGAGSGRKVKWLVHKGQPVQTDQTTEPYILRIDDKEFLDEDEFCHLVVPLVRSEQDNVSDDYGEHVTPHAEIECRVPTNLRHSKEAKLIQEAPKKAWHIPAALVLFLDGAVISFRCKIQNQEVGVTDVTYFRDVPVEQDMLQVSNQIVPTLSHSSRTSSIDAKADSVLSRTSSDDGKLIPVERPDSASTSPGAVDRRMSFKAVVNASWFTIRTKRDPTKDSKPKKEKVQYEYIPYGLYGFEKRIREPQPRKGSTSSGIQRTDSNATSDGRSPSFSTVRRVSTSSGSSGLQSIAAPKDLPSYEKWRLELEQQARKASLSASGSEPPRKDSSSKMDDQVSRPKPSKKGSSGNAPTASGSRPLEVSWRGTVTSRRTSILPDTDEVEEPETLEPRDTKRR